MPVIDKLLLFKFLKFSIVGLSGMFIDFGATWILKEKVKINRYIANVCGFVSVATSNYLLNRVWTFESHNWHIAAEYGSFFAIAVIGLGINTLVVWILSRKIKLNFYAAKLTATAIVTLWNFGMNFFFTFSKIQFLTLNSSSII